MRIFKNQILTPVKGLSELEWQALRRSFSKRGMIGGSDAGTLLPGFNKWKSPISLYYQALGLSPLPFKMNMEILHGKLQESDILNSWQYYSENDDEFIENVTVKRKPRKARQANAIIENPKYPELFANVDGIITKHPVMGKKKGILELKKINGMTVDTYIGGLPPQYIAQCQHYMMVCELDYAELCMRIDGHILAVHFIEKDKSVQDEILYQAKIFQARVKAAQEAIAEAKTDEVDVLYQIASQFEPEADNSEDFNKFISEKHKLRQEEITIQGDKEDQRCAEEFKDYGEQIKLLESEKQLRMNILKQKMEKEGASILELPAGRISWRKSFLCKLNDK